MELYSPEARNSPERNAFTLSKEFIDIAIGTLNHTIGTALRNYQYYVGKSRDALRNHDIEAAQSFLQKAFECMSGEGHEEDDLPPLRQMFDEPIRIMRPGNSGGLFQYYSKFASDNPSMREAGKAKIESLFSNAIRELGPQFQIVKRENDQVMELLSNNTEQSVLQEKVERLLGSIIALEKQDKLRSSKLPAT